MMIRNDDFPGGLSVGLPAAYDFPRGLLLAYDFPWGLLLAYSQLVIFLGAHCWLTRSS